jgi:asparagine synthase (glutamine-hydrolysing)
MCGIAGLVELRREAGADDRIRAMIARLRHRGPDGDGVLVDGNVALGHTRLAIVDVEHGAQPMTRGDASIVYNGEVYNAPRLRAEMVAAAARFETRADTEVVLERYLQDSSHFEDELVGMWALAILDRRRRRVVLSRDRFGIKPLFVVRGTSGVAFASELGALRAVASRFPGAFDIDHDAAHAMLSWAYVPGTATIYRGVRRVAPGTRLEIDLDSGAINEHRYYRPRPAADAARVRTLQEACELISPLVAQAGREHLESDVPIAAFLSGGIDSSLVLDAAAAAGGPPVRAFTIGFRDPRFDESPFAREVATALGIELEVDYLDEAALLKAVGGALAAYDEPFGDSSSLATYVLSRAVGQSHKVALGGDGGDEVFAGYRKHRIVSMRSLLGRIPGAMSLSSMVLSRLPARTDRTTSLGEFLRTLERVSRGLSGDDATSYVALTQVAALTRTTPLVRNPGGQEFADEIVATYRSAPGGALLRTRICDLENVLPNDMLTKVDRASMAHHVEARVPLLDHRIVEAGLGLPDAFTLGRSGKVVLRELYRRRFGERLAARRKQGFAVPVERWLASALEPACKALLARERLDHFGILSSAELSNGGHRRWLREHPYLIWHVLAFAAWCEVHHGQGPDRLAEIFDDAGARSATSDNRSSTSMARAR